MSALVPDREVILARIVQAIGYASINRLTLDQINFLIDHQIRHEEVRTYILHSMAYSNLSDLNEDNAS